jgi:hypothetical protein
MLLLLMIDAILQTGALIQLCIITFMANKREYLYDYTVAALLVGAGHYLIEGAREALDCPDHLLFSIYSEEYACKALSIGENVKECFLL